MENLSVEELRVVKHSLEVHLKDCEAFKRGHYGRFTKEEKNKIDKKINIIKEVLTRLDQ